MCPDIKIAVMFKCDLRIPTFPKWVICEGGHAPALLAATQPAAYSSNFLDQH